MRNKKNDKYAYISFALITIGMTYSYFDSKEFDKKAVYCLGKIDDVKWAYRGDKKIWVSYKFKNRYYNVYSVGYGYEYSDSGKKVFIGILPNDPDGTVDVKQNCPVPDSIKEAPFNGWQTLPVNCNCDE